MTHLAKLTFISVNQTKTRDPIMARRDKLMAGLKEQALVYAAALDGKDHRVEQSKWMQNELGQRVIVKVMRHVRPWFFAQDGGWYVQCRYGARVIAVDGQNNAVFVKSLKDVGGVLDAFAAAAGAGELDAAITRVAQRQPRVKPSTAKAATNG
jgi:hypothetical protein